MPNPEVSVLLVACGRREFVADALSSIVRQELDRSHYEVVLVTDQDFPELQPVLETHGVACVRPPPGSWGAWVRAALSSCHADVLCFLDDDDLFETGKLSAVRSAFREHPALAYYHNRIQRFRHGPEQGAESRSASSERPIGPAVGLVAGAGKDRATIDGLFWGGGGFNLSSIGVRRSVLEALGPLLVELELGHALALFYAAARGPGDLYFDPKVLTRYRIHPGNQSAPAGARLAVGWRKSVRNAPAVIRDADRIARFIDADRRPRLSSRPVRSVGQRSELLLRLNSPEARRFDLLRTLGTYLGLTPLGKLSDQAGLLALTGLGLVDRRFPSRWIQKSAAP